ncbi:Histone-lysine N-methyltransferase PRDM9 [Frankliniella fusca]|uniref:Histone-lysine N-methyltransferase PRDM9 n=1 Tax=Frankliniella fusca TaxID=407009 RepID=A0AAE1GSS9_9NEOP|nr:Histone-lysine N-methyltransferase PRDM9 [Frankliniella fusca]
MSTSDSDSSEFEDIKEYFSASDWKELCSYEKWSYRNSRENFLHMQRCGFTPKAPAFMTPKQPAKQRQPARQLQKRPAGKQAAKKRKCDDTDDDDDADDEKDLDWSPTKDDDEARSRPSQQARSKFAPPLPRPAAPGKEKVAPAGTSRTSTTSSARARSRSKRRSAGASDETSAPPQQPPSEAAPEPGTATAESDPQQAQLPRYPKRAGTRRTYTEPELQDDDDYLFCDECQKEWEGDCPEHGPLEVVADTEVAVGHPERALLTVPRQLVVELSKIPGAGRGVWTREAVPQRVRFGPYEGDVAPSSKETGYGWEIRREGKLTHCIDALNIASSNWMRFVNCARHSGEENLYPFQYKGRLYYRTVRPVPANTELLVWYGDSYAKELGLDPKAYRDPAALDRRALNGAFPCEQCSICYASPLLVAQHHRSTRCSAEIRRRRACGDRDRALGGSAGRGPEPEAAGEGRRRTEHQHQQAAATGTGGDRPHRCETCGGAFKRSSHLHRHMRTHTGETPYTCQTCGAGFSRSGNLHSHMRTHTGEKPYTCQTCGAGFTQNVHLHVHMRTHTGEKPYTCQTCGAGFSHISSLHVHMRTHTGEKPYTCQTCGAAFSHSSSLHVHMRTHTGEKPYTCQTCGAAFSHLSSLHVHMRTHTGEKPYTCQTCGAGFSKSAHLHRHMRTHTGEKPYTPVRPVEPVSLTVDISTST